MWGERSIDWWFVGCLLFCGATHLIGGGAEDDCMTANYRVGNMLLWNKKVVRYWIYLSKGTSVV